MFYFFSLLIAGSAYGALEDCRNRFDGTTIELTRSTHLALDTDQSILAQGIDGSFRRLINDHRLFTVTHTPNSSFHSHSLSSCNLQGNQAGLTSHIVLYGNLLDQSGYASAPSLKSIYRLESHTANASGPNTVEAWQRKDNSDMLTHTTDDSSLRFDRKSALSFQVRQSIPFRDASFDRHASISLAAGSLAAAAAAGIGVWRFKDIKNYFKSRIEVLKNPTVPLF